MGLEFPGCKGEVQAYLEGKAAERLETGRGVSFVLVLGLGFGGHCPSAPR